METVGRGYRTTHSEPAGEPCTVYYTGTSLKVVSNDALEDYLHSGLDASVGWAVVNDCSVDPITRETFINSLNNGI